MDPWRSNGWIRKNAKFTALPKKVLSGITNTGLKRITVLPSRQKRPQDSRRWPSLHSQESSPRWTQNISHSPSTVLVRNNLPTAQNFTICLGVLRKGHGAKMYRVTYTDQKFNFLQNFKKCVFQERKTMQWGFLAIFRGFIVSWDGFRNTRCSSYCQKKNTNKKILWKEQCPKGIPNKLPFFEAGFFGVFIGGYF